MCDLFYWNLSWNSLQKTGSRFSFFCPLLERFFFSTYARSSSLYTSLFDLLDWIINFFWTSDKTVELYFLPRWQVVNMFLNTHWFNSRNYHFLSEYKARNFRSSRREVFLRKSVLQKQLYWNHNSARVFFCKFAAYW